MKREKINVLSEKDILIGLIVSDEFCKEIVPIIEPKFFEVDYVRFVSTWIKDFYKDYERAPKTDILKLYRTHYNQIQDEDLRLNILTLLEKICNSYEEASFNYEFAIQQATKYLKKCSIRDLAQSIDAYALSDDVEKAEILIHNYHRVEKASGESVSLLNDSEIVLEAFMEEKSKLFSFNGAFGKLVGDICREDFVAFLAPMKAGKTFQLIDVGIEACRNGLNVVFFSLEMSRTAMIKRAWRAMSGQVLEDVEIEVPVFKEDEDGKFRIETKTINKKACDVLEVEKVQKKLKRIFRGGSFRIYAEPAYSLTVEGLDKRLDDLNHEGIIPDVIIVDYADIMAPSERGEYRNQLDGIWKRLRGLAQKRKAVVFTASQTNRSAISREVETEDIAEDVRKLAHVTCMISISKPKYYKEHSLALYSQLVNREGEPIVRKVVATQCLSLGRPVLESKWKDEVIFNYNNEEDDETEENNKKFVKRLKK